MNENEIKQKLDRLAEFRAEYNFVTIEKQAAVEALYSAEIKARVDEVSSEFSAEAESIAASIAALESEIKSAVKAHGKTVKGSSLQAVWAKPKFSYSDEPKEGYIQSLAYRKLGEPSVSIRGTA